MSHRKIVSRPIEQFHYVILFGPTGVGKDTLSGEIRALHSYQEVGGTASTELRLSKDVDFKHQMAQQISEQRGQGQFIDDEVIMETLGWHIDHNEWRQNDLLVNGVPRTVGQAKLLGRFLHQLRHDARVAFLSFGNVTQDLLIERIKKRNEETPFEKKRVDDGRLDVIVAKIKKFYETRDQIIAVGSKYAHFKELDASKTSDKVFRQAAEFLGLGPKLEELKLLPD